MLDLRGLHSEPVEATEVRKGAPFHTARVYLNIVSQGHQTGEGKRLS